MGRAGRAKRHQRAVAMWNAEQAVRRLFAEDGAGRVWAAGLFFVAVVIIAPGAIEGWR